MRVCVANSKLKKVQDVPFLVAFTGIRAGTDKGFIGGEKNLLRHRWEPRPQTAQKCTSVYIFDRRVCLAANIAYIWHLPASCRDYKLLFRMKSAAAGDGHSAKNSAQAKEACRLSAVSASEASRQPFCGVSQYPVRYRYLGGNNG